MIFIDMKKSDLKKLVSEEIRRMKQRRKFLRESELENNASTSASINPKKAQGIIAGAIKTLINSGATNGLDQSQVDQLTQNLIKHLSDTIPTMKPVSSPSQNDDNTNSDLNDEIPFKKENDKLEDQNQYDPDLRKVAKSGTDSKENKPQGGSENNEDPFGGADEPLFEASYFKKFLK